VNKQEMDLFQNKRVAAILFTGGKDSTRTIELLRRSGYKIACLVTMISENLESYMLHTSNIRVVDFAAQALEIPLVTGHTMGRKEEELDDIRNTVNTAMNQFGFDTLGCGGIASEYQRSRVESIADKLGLKTACPLWGVEQFSYMQEIVAQGYRFILTSVSAAGLDKSWLGREISYKDALELSKLSEKFHFNLAFEGGEAETLVLDCPLFLKQRLQIFDQEVEWFGDYGRLRIKKISLAAK